MSASHSRRACPSCGAAGAHALHENVMASLGGLDMSYTVASCAACGLIHAANLPPAQQYREYYGRFSKYDVTPGVSGFDAARNSAALALVDGLVPRDASIVDVGCGNGSLLGLLKSAGYRNLHGVDPAPNAAAIARSAFGVDGVRRGTMAEAHCRVPLAGAGLVLVMSVLEHLWEPRRDIAGLLAHLQPGARILIEVPALDTFDGSRGEPFGELSLEHIQFFSSSSLDRFMAGLGAMPVRRAYADLAVIAAKTLLAVYEVSGNGTNDVPAAAADAAVMRAYLESCAVRLGRALAAVPAGEVIVYGGGSHTARLLPLLGGRGTFVRFIADANTNLQGSQMGASDILAPEAIASFPALPVIVSSYRYQREIEARLRQRYPNPVVTLY